MACLDENLALKYVEGLLTPQEVQAIDAHLANCEECRWLLSAASAAAQDDSQGQKSLAVTKQLSPQDPIAVVSPATWSGETIDGYLVGRLIGRGGMGSVFEATSASQPGQQLAIKLLSWDRSSDAGAVARMRREAKITRQLTHPNIVRVFDFGSTRINQPYIVMELLQGKPLAARLKRMDVEPLGLRTVLALMRQICSALSAAHEKGIVHRDLKPANLFLCEGEPPLVKLMDFGISKVWGSSLTGTADVLGTPRYMAPEQARGESSNVNARADLFAVGAILFHLLTGAPPFDGDSVHKILYQVVNDPPTCSESFQTLPAPIKQVLLRALSKDPEDRQQSADELWQQLRHAVEQSELSNIEHQKTNVLLTEDSVRGSTTRRPAEQSELSDIEHRKTTVLLLEDSALPGPLASTQALAPRTKRRPDTPPREISDPEDGATREPLSSIQAMVLNAKRPAASGAKRQWLVVAAFMAVGAVIAGVIASDSSGQFADAPDLASSVSKTYDAAPLFVEDAGRQDVPTAHDSSRVEESSDFQIVEVRRPRRDLSQKRQRRHPKRPKYGCLVLQTESQGQPLWATAYLDGKRVGQTGLVLKKVRVGRHRVQLRRTGYHRISRWVSVKPGKCDRLRFNLRPR